MTPLSSRQQWSAGALALLFHAVFFTALVFSVSWRQAPERTVMAELWSSMPPPRPAPQVKIEPKPLPPPPQPEPVVEPPKPPKVDIEVQAKKKPEPPKPELVEKPKPEPKKPEPEKKPIDQAAQKKALDRALAEQMANELAQEDAELNKLRQQQQAAAARGKAVADYQERIRQKIRGYIRLPRNLTGNPEAIFRVELLPNGEVLRATLMRSSGSSAYDEEVERAILKASPLPMPQDPLVAAGFRSGLTLKFRPQDN